MRSNHGCGEDEVSIASVNERVTKEKGLDEGSCCDEGLPSVSFDVDLVAL